MSSKKRTLGGTRISRRQFTTMCQIALKSLLLAGVKPDDARVKAALVWIRSNYDLASNPGVGSAGLHHYYHVLAKTVSLLGVDVVEDTVGVKHNWRSELCEQLVRRQRKDGSWPATGESRDCATAMACIVLPTPNDHLPIQQR